MNSIADKYKSIESNTTSLFKDRGSKFLGFAYPINSVEEAKKVLVEIKKEHPKATHHCFAYRLGTDGLSFRASDDGEPSGSAGRPILGQIDSVGYTNIIVVVVRYYGGTMLGVPGLINAYKSACQEALSYAIPTEKWICQRVEITLDYNVMGEVLYLLKQAEATIITQELQLFCSIIADIPKVHFEQYAAQLLSIRGLGLKPSVS
ncbi:MAG: YigZ family protein [Chitinophagaceae bacterium]|nr:YigZ family protein [Chitinophagaceae bacterium]